MSNSINIPAIEFTIKNALKKTVTNFTVTDHLVTYEIGSQGRALGIFNGSIESREEIDCYAATDENGKGFIRLWYSPPSKGDVIKGPTYKDLIIEPDAIIDIPEGLIR